jgi:hypothetical protein
MISEPLKILQSTEILVAPETFVLVSIRRANGRKLIEVPEASPRMSAPFMILMDNDEVTMMLDDIDFEAVRPTLGNARIEGGYRLLTFDIELDVTLVGFLAEVSRILAEAEIPIMALSAFSRDHLLIKQEKLAKALKILGKYVAAIR